MHIMHKTYSTLVLLFISYCGAKLSYNVVVQAQDYIDFSPVSLIISTIRETGVRLMGILYVPIAIHAAPFLV